MKKVDGEEIPGGGEDRWGGRVLSSMCRSVPHNGLSRGKKSPHPVCSICVVYVDFCIVNSPTRADLNLPSM